MSRLQLAEKEVLAKIIMMRYKEIEGHSLGKEAGAEGQGASVLFWPRLLTQQTLLASLV